VNTAGTDGSFLCQLGDMDEFRATVASSQSVQLPPPPLTAVQKRNDRNLFSDETSTTVGRQDVFGQLQLPPGYSATQPVTATSW